MKLELEDKMVLIIIINIWTHIITFAIVLCLKQVLFTIGSNPDLSMICDFVGSNCFYETMKNVSTPSTCSQCLGDCDQVRGCVTLTSHVHFHELRQCFPTF